MRKLLMNRLFWTGIVGLVFGCLSTFALFAVTTLYDQKAQNNNLLEYCQPDMVINEIDNDNLMIIPDQVNTIMNPFSMELVDCPVIEFTEQGRALWIQNMMKAHSFNEE